jgi:ComF family protein
VPRGRLLGAMRTARRLSSAALDLLWPPVCPSCGQGLEPGTPSRLCQRCLLELPLISGRTCRRCGMPLGPFEEDNYGRFCVDCGQKSLVFKRASCAGLYQGSLAETIKAYKYTPRARCAHLAGFLAGLLADRLAHPECTLEAADAQLILPVPTHRSRRRARGFDSTAEIARELAARLDKPLALRQMIRTRPTQQQMGLTRAARLENVKDSFALRRPDRVEGKLVLLIDDVMTTCATAEECARTLRAAGAREIRVAAVARAVEGRNSDPGQDPKL